MWPWGPPTTSSTPSYQSPAYSIPHMQHMTPLPGMQMSHLSANPANLGMTQLASPSATFPTSQPAGTYYSPLSVPEMPHSSALGYSGGLRLSTPQSLAQWSNRVPQVGSSPIQLQSEGEVAYLQQQQPSLQDVAAHLHAPSSMAANNAHPSIQSSPLHSSFSSQHSHDGSYQPQGAIVSPRGHQAIYQPSPVDNSPQSVHLSPYQAGSPSPMHVGGFRQLQPSAISPEAHTPAFQTPTQGMSCLPTGCQGGLDGNSTESPSSFQQIQNMDGSTPTDVVHSNPFQPTQIIGGAPVHTHGVVQSVGPAESTMGYGLGSGHHIQAEPRPFSVDFLLRDRPAGGGVTDVPAVGYSSNQAGFVPETDSYPHQEMTPSHSDPLTLYRSDSPSQIADCLPPLHLDSLSPSNQQQGEGERMPDALNERPFSPPELVPKETEHQDGYSPMMQYDVTGRSHDWERNVSSLHGGEAPSSSFSPGVSHDISKEDHTDHVTFDDKVASPSSSKSSLDDDTGTNLVICEGVNTHETSNSDREAARGSSKMGPFHIAAAFQDGQHQRTNQSKHSNPGPSNELDPPFVTADDFSQPVTSKVQEKPIEQSAESGTSNAVTEQPTDNHEPVPPANATVGKEKEVTTDSAKIMNYVSPLVRHQRNRGYESSDDDDVFLPNPVSKLRTEDSSHVVMETEGETTEDARTTEDEMEVEKKEIKVCLSKVEEQSSPAVIDKTETKSSSTGAPPPPVVIKRGRGTAKTLDMNKLQLPLAQGWSRLVRKRIGADQVRVDICYVSPEGRRLRTFPEIQNHLDLTESGELTRDHFTFSKKVDLGEVQDQSMTESASRGSRGTKRGRGSRRGTRGGGLSRQDHVTLAQDHVSIEAQSPITDSGGSISPSLIAPKVRGRGRGRGGRCGGGGRGTSSPEGSKKARRPRKVGESSKSIRGEKSQLATHSTRAVLPVPPSTATQQSTTNLLDGSAQGIAAVSTATAVALIKKAIRETDIENSSSNTDSPAVDDGQQLAQSSLRDEQPKFDVSSATQRAGIAGIQERSVTQRAGIAGIQEDNVAQIAGIAGIPESSVTQRPGIGGIQERRVTFEAGIGGIQESSVAGVDKAEQTDDSLAVLSSTAISSQVLHTTTKEEFKIHLHTPSNLATSSRGRGRSTGKGRSRKRKSEQPHPGSSTPSSKRPRGRPKVVGVNSQPAANEVPQRKRRGRKPKTVLPNTSHTILRPIAPSHGDSLSSLDGGAMNGEAGVSVIMPAGVVASSDGMRSFVSQTSKQVQEEKRRQLLLKARADKAKKKEARHLQRTLIVNQRKLAQRQRRERERILMKQARDKQEKLSRQREAEDREVRRQCVAKQKEVDYQKKAKERTLKLIAHLKQQEIERSRRLYQQQLEMEKAQQLKRPVEDLEVRESTSLPTLASLGWVKLPSESFADLLMVVEFGHSFAEFLEVESRVPSLADIYLALFNYDKGRALLDLFMQLLKAAVYDPGTHAMTMSGNHIEDVHVTALTFSELLRLYLEDHCEVDMGNIVQTLETSPVQCLRPSEKVKVLKFLVGELLDSMSLTREVDTRMEQTASLRREKWKISLKMKRFRSRLSTVYGIGDKTRPIAYSGRGRPPKRAVMGTLQGEGPQSQEVGDSSDEGDDPGQTNVDEEVGGVASESEYSEEETDEETPDGKDNLLQRLKALKKKFAFVRTRIHNTSHLMRKFPLGQDRYARQYWVLPNMGGVIVEGVETSLDKNLQVNLDFVDLSAVKPGVVQSGEASENVGVASAVESVKSDHPINITGDDSAEGIDLSQVDEGNQAAKDELTDEKMDVESQLPSSLNALNRDSGLHIEHKVDSKSPSTEAVHHTTSDDVIDSHCSNSGPTVMVGSVPDSPQKSVKNLHHSRMPTSKVLSNSLEKTDNRPVTGNCVASTHKRTSEHQEAVKSKNMSLQQGTAQEAAYNTNSLVPHKQLSPSQESRMETTAVIPTHSNKTKLTDQCPSRFAQRQEQQDTQLEHTNCESNSSFPPPLLSGSIEQRSQGLATQEINQPDPQVHTSLSCSESLEEEDEAKNDNQTSQQLQEQPTDPGLSTQQPSTDSSTVHSHVEIEQGRITTENTKPWFSLGPRNPCETTRLAYVNNQTVIGSGSAQPQQQVVTASPSQQQYIMAAPTAQYAYMTPDGQVVAAAGGQAMIQQVGVGYGLIGNTLVQVPQTQYVAVDSSGGVIGNFIGQQNPSVQYAVTQNEGGGVQYVALGDPGGGTGYVTVGGAGGQPTIMQAVNREGGGQMLVQVMQDERGQVVLPVDEKTQQVVSYTGERNQVVQVGVVNNEPVTKTEGGVNAEAGGLARGAVKMETERSVPTLSSVSHPGSAEVKVQIDTRHIKEEDEVPAVQKHLDASRSTPPDRAANSVAVQDGTLVQHGGSSHVQTMSSEALGSHGDSSPPQQTQVVQDSQASPQYVTAVVPGGPDGSPRYVSLPADPRVISGQCSYAVLQQPDGTQQIVLVDNSSVGAYPQASADASSTSPSTTVMSMEVPPPALMDNESEAESSLAPITLMYAQQTLSFLEGRREEREGSKEKNLRELLEEQDIDLTHGWWSITKPEIIDKLLKAFCTRGVREKCLAKSIQKNKDNISTTIQPAIIESFESSFNQLLKAKVNINGSRNELKRQSSDVAMDTSETGNDVGTSNEEVSMSVSPSGRGVKADPGMEGVKSESASTSSMTSSSSTENGGSITSNSRIQPTNEIQVEPSYDYIEPGVSDPTFPRFCLESLLMVVEYLEGMQSRLFTAQLHNESVELWDSISPKVKIQGHTSESFSLISDHLLQLESCIDRIHLKPPLRDRKIYIEEQEQEKEDSSKSKQGSRRDHTPLAVRRDSSPLELPSENLLSWRMAVVKARSASQLAVCMSELEICVAWEKSNYIVFCQVCHGGENESLLLLCDGCDKGTHTYCCKPKLSIVPEGDWYCHDCVTSNSKYRPCYVCDSKRGVLLSCAVCPRNYHKRCLNPPLNKLPASPWKCPNCKNKPIPHSRQKVNIHSSRKKDKTLKTDNGICRTLLKEMETRNDSWPFLVPVEKKKFPGYHRVIKKPMDFQTMRNKLDEGRYKEDRDQFAADARQVFSNCAYYNEDNSEIGTAGHNMRAFFEKRWTKLNNSA